MTQRNVARVYGRLVEHRVAPPQRHDTQQLQAIDEV